MKGIQHRTVVACLWVVLAITTLTACQQTIADIEEEANFAKACEDNGGDVYYYGFVRELIGCDYTTENP